jgi:hypothetical protein
VCAEIIGKGCRFEPPTDVDTGDSGESASDHGQGSVEAGGEPASDEGGGGEVKGETQKKNNAALVAVCVSLPVFGVFAAVLWFIVRPWCFGKLDRSGGRLSDRVEVSDVESLASSDGDLSCSRAKLELKNGLDI